LTGCTGLVFQPNGSERLVDLRSGRWRRRAAGQRSHQTLSQSSQRASARRNALVVTDDAERGNLRADQQHCPPLTLIKSRRPQIAHSPGRVDQPLGRPELQDDRLSYQLAGAQNVFECHPLGEFPLRPVFRDHSQHYLVMTEFAAGLA